MTETSYSHIVLTWTKPEDKPGIQDEAKGYFVEIRQAECMEWSRCNTTPIITTSYSVKGLRSMDTYWLRVIAINDGGESAAEELPNYVTAMPSPGTSPILLDSLFHYLKRSYPLSEALFIVPFIIPVRPKFTNHNMKSFRVVRAGNSVRIIVNFEVKFILINILMNCEK